MSNEGFYGKADLCFCLEKHLSNKWSLIQNFVRRHSRLLVILDYILEAMAATCFQLQQSYQLKRLSLTADQNSVSKGKIGTLRRKKRSITHSAQCSMASISMSLYRFDSNLLLRRLTKAYLRAFSRIPWRIIRTFFTSSMNKAH